MTRVRPYDPATDPGALAAIFHAAVQGTADHHSQAQRDDWSPVCPTAESWRARLEGLVTLVAEEASEPVGFMSMDMATGLLDLAFVRPDHARRGVGARLYEALMAEATARGLAAFTVEASPASRAFLAARGWRETGTRLRGEGEAQVTTVLMAFGDGP